MKRFLLLALTAGLFSHTPASALFGEKEGTKVWSSHRILENSSYKIYREYDSFTEKAKCYSGKLDFYERVRLSGYDGDLRILNEETTRVFGERKYITRGIEIKYGKNKAKPFTNKYGFLLFDDYSKYKTIKLRFDTYRDGIVTNTINTSEVRKFIKSYKACKRSTSK